MSHLQIKRKSSFILPKTRTLSNLHQKHLTFVPHFIGVSGRTKGTYEKTEQLVIEYSVIMDMLIKTTRVRYENHSTTTSTGTRHPREGDRNRDKDGRRGEGGVVETETSCTGWSCVKCTYMFCVRGEIRWEGRWRDKKTRKCFRKKFLHWKRQQKRKSDARESRVRSTRRRKWSKTWTKPVTVVH